MVTLDFPPPTEPAAARPNPADAKLPESKAEQLAVLRAARQRTRKVRRAARFAAFSAWTLAVFAGLTALGVLFGSMLSLLLAALLGAFAWNEFRGARALRRIDPAGARILGFNQVGLGVFLVGYAAWNLLSPAGDAAVQSALAGVGDAQTEQMVRDLSDMVRVALYGSLAVVGAVATGLTAVYYFTRGRFAREAARDTPAWAIELLDAARD